VAGDMKVQHSNELDDMGKAQLPCIYST
jgi:hypothetical protein